MKTFFLKFLAISIAIGFSIIALGLWSDSVYPIWAGFLGSAISAVMWFWFFHLFYEHRSNRGKK